MRQVRRSMTFRGTLRVFVSKSMFGIYWCVRSSGAVEGVCLEWDVMR